MIYGYVRVSTDKQDNANQTLEINNFCARKQIKVDEWIHDVISGTKEPKKRRLGPLLAKVVEGDTIIACEVSRFGRSLYMVMDILKGLLEKGVAVLTIKDGYTLDDSLQSKVLAFAFGLAAEIERDMISKRTKAALARKRLEGVILGRPKGTKTGSIVLKGREDEIRKYLLEDGHSKREAARLMGVDRSTLCLALKSMDMSGYVRKTPNIMQGKHRASICDQYKPAITEMLHKGITLVNISETLKLPIHTLRRYARIHDLHPKEKVYVRPSLCGPHREVIVRMLASGGNVTTIAKALGITKTAVQGYIYKNKLRYEARELQLVTPTKEKRKYDMKKRNMKKRKGAGGMIEISREEYNRLMAAINNDTDMVKETGL
jgi:DNA invertase Pin-like site-specific DNA recombinase